jgi:hypothetical protein
VRAGDINIFHVKCEVLTFRRLVVGHLQQMQFLLTDSEPTPW